MGGGRAAWSQQGAVRLACGSGGAAEAELPGPVQPDVESNGSSVGGGGEGERAALQPRLQRRASRVVRI